VVIFRRLVGFLSGSASDQGFNRVPVGNLIWLVKSENRAMLLYRGDDPAAGCQGDEQASGYQGVAPMPNEKEMRALRLARRHVSPLGPLT
jgi:hypothetical protein